MAATAGDMTRKWREPVDRRSLAGAAVMAACGVVSVLAASARPARSSSAC